MKTNNAIKSAIRSLTTDRLKSNMFVCSVTSVDEAKHTCAADTLNADGTKSGLIGIKLNCDPNDSFMIVPAIDSTIFVVMTSNKEFYMCGWADIDKIVCQIDNNISLIGDSSGWVFNDGNNDGMIKISPFISKINKIEAYLNALYIVLSGLTPAGPETGLAAMKASILAASTEILNIGTSTKTDYENKKVKH